DTLNGLMALPNLVGLLLLTMTLKKLVKDYDKKNAAGKITPPDFFNEL
ncbi:MAG: alanine:cation symporter family protein, partial [Synergistaceae bacterium]|nr:alanine:cation symporter family protein [Synergistaceae bacterium]